MPISPKYMCAWMCISSICIYSSCWNISFFPTPVCTNNERFSFCLQQSVPLMKCVTIHICWLDWEKSSTTTLDFETELSNLSASFYISFVALRSSLSQCGYPRFILPWNSLGTRFTWASIICGLMLRLLSCAISSWSCLLVNTIYSDKFYNPSVL